MVLYKIDVPQEKPRMTFICVLIRIGLICIYMYRTKCSAAAITHPHHLHGITVAPTPTLHHFPHQPRTNKPTLRHITAHRAQHKVD